MAVTVLEALMNANHNVKTVVEMRAIMLLPMAHSQLNNAVVLLEKGYSLDDLVEPLLEEYGSIEDVPEKEIT